MAYRRRPAERRDLPALMAIAEAQARARREADPRLSAGSHLIPFLSKAETLAEALSERNHATFVVEQDDVVVGGVNLHKVEQRDDDPFATYYPRRFASIGLLAARVHPAPSVHPVPSAPLRGAAEGIQELIAQAQEQAARWKTPSLLIHSASADRAIHELLRAQGFRVYYHYAMRAPAPLPPLLEDSPMVSLPHRPAQTGSNHERELVVRHAQKDDLREVVRIGMQSVRYHAFLEPTMQVARNEPQKMRRRFEDILYELTHAALFVAEWSGQIVGFYSIYIQSIDETWTPPLFAAGRYGLIAEVAVDEAHRHRGVGRRMFAAVSQWFSERGVGAFWLIYLPHNPLSSKFWASLGFEPIWEVLFRD